MPAITHGQSDTMLDQLAAALATYVSDHPRAAIDMYRRNSVSLWVRVVDPDLAGRNRFERNDYVWEYLKQAPEEVQEDVALLLLLTPDEVPKSYANRDFEDPIPSDL